MGKRGPLPKKNVLKVLSGQLPVTKENGINENIVSFEPPRAPDHLTADEKEVWDYTIELLKPLCVLEKIDVGVLDAYCCTYVRWRDVESQIQEMSQHGKIHGLLIEGATGSMIANPLVTMSRHERAALVTYAQQLGMTPAARMRINIVKEKPKDNPFSRIKNSKNGRMDVKSKAVRKVSHSKSQPK